jgi:hypothetical protein
MVLPLKFVGSFSEIISPFWIILLTIIQPSKNLVTTPQLKKHVQNQKQQRTKMVSKKHTENKITAK